MSNGFVYSEGLLPQQGETQSQAMRTAAAATADSIFKAGTMIESKRREANRRFERAQNMMRTDINAIAAFDVTVGGAGQWADILNEKANWARAAIRRANDPVIARDIISEFRDYYNLVKQTYESGTEAITQYNTINKSSGDQLEGYNETLPAGHRYERSDVSEQAQALHQRNNIFTGIHYDDRGNALVNDENDRPIPWDTSPLATDFSMYQSKIVTRDVGGLREIAQNDNTKKFIGFSHDGYWNHDEAVDLFYTSIDVIESDNQSAAIEFRLKILNDADALGKNLFTTDEERKAFELGDYDITDPTDKKFALMEEWGKDRFVALSRFVKEKDALELKEQKERELEQEAQIRLFSGASIIQSDADAAAEIMGIAGGDPISDSGLGGNVAVYPVADIGAVQLEGEYGQTIVVPSTLTIHPNGDIVVHGMEAERKEGSGVLLPMRETTITFEQGTDSFIRNSTALDQALQSAFGQGLTIDYLSSPEALEKLKKHQRKQEETPTQTQASGGVMDKYNELK